MMWLPLSVPLWDMPAYPWDKGGSSAVGSKCWPSLCHTSYSPLYCNQRPSSTSTPASASASQSTRTDNSLQKVSLKDMNSFPYKIAHRKSMSLAHILTQQFSKLFTWTDHFLYNTVGYWMKVEWIWQIPDERISYHMTPIGQMWYEIHEWGIFIFIKLESNNIFILYFRYENLNRGIRPNNSLQRFY